MLDHYEITKTLREYCGACDRGDAARMAAVYAEDSWDDHGGVRAPGPEFARIMTERIRDSYLSMSHLLGQSTVKVVGDEAGAETYFFAVARSRGEDGEEVCNQMGGRFVDRLVREEGRWRIQHRSVVRDWTVRFPIDDTWPTAMTLPEGQLSAADPALAVLGIEHGG